MLILFLLREVLISCYLRRCKIKPADKGLKSLLKRMNMPLIDINITDLNK